jgi:hypothetical protein
MLHYTTTNLSALKMYHLYRDMGIKNCDFFLELHDEKLLEVNPYDPNLDNITKARIQKEVAINPWYFIRECVRIPEAGSVPFEFHRGNIAIIWAILNNISFFAILPRQMGKTYTMAVVYEHLLYWGTMKTTGMMYSYSEDHVKANLDRIRKIRDELPSYLKYHEGIDNQHEISFSVLGNKFKVKAPGKSKEDAMKVGRGFSSPLQWYDEFAFISNIQHQYESALYAYSTVSQVAKKNGLPYHKAITCTAAPLNTPEAKWSYKFLRNCADFSETLYDKTKEEVEEYISASSTNGILRIEFMYYDLSKDDGYFARMVKESDNNWDAINREVLNMWLDSSSDHPLGQDNVIVLNNNIHTPKKTLVIDDVYLLKLYKNLDEINWDAPLVAGMDCGGNVMRDFSTLVVVDPTNMEVIATLRSNSFSTTRFSHAIFSIMMNVFPNLILVPERNSMGIAIIDNILESDMSMRARIYHDESGKPGIHNNQTIRPQLFNDILKIAIVEDYDKIHDRSIIQEISMLVVSRSGRIDHARDEHDDTLMGYLLARWMLTFAKNRKMYIPLELIQSRSKNAGATGEGDKMQTGDSKWIKGYFSGTLPPGEHGFDLSGRGEKKIGNRTDSQLFSEIEHTLQHKASGIIETIDGNGISEEDMYDKTVDDIKATVTEKRVKVDVRQQDKPIESQEDITDWLKVQLRRM